MITLIPWEKVMEKHMSKPGFAEGVERARRELKEEIAMYGTIGNPKPTPHRWPRRTKRRCNPQSLPPQRAGIGQSNCPKINEIQ